MENFGTMFDDTAIKSALAGLEAAQSNTEVTMSALPANPVLAMSYVPMQFYRDMYSTEKGFSAGTIYPELDKPFYGGNIG